MALIKKLFRDGPYADLFSQGVQVGNTLYLAGQVGTDASGKASDNLVEQMKNAYQHVESVLAEFDCTMDNVVEETWFVTDMQVHDTGSSPIRSTTGDLWKATRGCPDAGASRRASRS